MSSLRRFFLNFRSLFPLLPLWILHWHVPYIAHRRHGRRQYGTGTSYRKVLSVRYPFLRFGQPLKIKVKKWRLVPIKGIFSSENDTWRVYACAVSIHDAKIENTSVQLELHLLTDCRESRVKRDIPTLGAGLGCVTGTDCCSVYERYVTMPLKSQSSFSPRPTVPRQATMGLWPPPTQATSFTPRWMNCWEVNPLIQSIPTKYSHHCPIGA